MDKLTHIKIAGIPTGFQELKTTINDITMNYVVGPDNGLPLLLIPGQMEAWQGYKCVLPELAKRFQVFVPDLRGHGKTTWTPGHYSYNICGNDLKLFIQQVIGRPALVAGLSSGAVLAIWLAAYAPEEVIAIISEDPPIFSSIWPRIRDEKFMTRNFKVAVDVLGKPGERDVIGYLSEMGAPVEGKADLLKIPPFILKIMSLLEHLGKTIHPDAPHDIPLMPYNMRAGHKFLSEYDTDFSRATIDGDLSRDFDPEDALKRVQCPMLLLWANGYRHETWGLIGAMDKNDFERVIALVPNLQTVEIPGAHEIHMVQPQRYMDELTRFVDGLKEKNALHPMA
jgi:pimeloyl-ACP methyl ester carboxylesterase